MIIKLQEHGNELAAIFNQKILKKLNIDKKTELELSIENGSLILKPVLKRTKKIAESEDIEDPKLNKIYKKVVKKYDKALKKLSKN